MSDLVSVIFPVGPGVFDAGLALNDLLGQSYSRLEVVAVLNGCPEGVRREFLGRNDSRLRIIDFGCRTHWEGVGTRINFAGNRGLGLF